VANIDEVRGKSCYLNVEDNIFGNVGLCLLHMDVKYSLSVASRNKAPGNGQRTAEQLAFHWSVNLVDQVALDSCFPWLTESIPLCSRLSVYLGIFVQLDDTVLF
jgi:hypothetical protein